MRLAERTQRIFLLCFAGLIVLVLVCIGLYFLLLLPAVKQSVTGGSGSSLIQASGLRNTYVDPNAGVVFLVPASSIPKTQTQRYSAAADALLADRWANNSAADTQVGPTQDKASIPATDRQSLISSVTAFLQQWETFTPPTLVQAATAIQDYTDRLAPWVAPADLSDIVGRVDNSQGGNVCPQSGCLVGSSYVAGDTWNEANVRFFNGASAYVTAYGNVTYHAVFGESPLDGVTYQRSYGLLLSFIGGRWVVARAAAATDGITS